MPEIIAYEAQWQETEVVDIVDETESEDTEEQQEGGE